MKAKIIIGDVRTALNKIKEDSVQTCITSPPYWGLRDYGEDNQIGLEQSPEEYVEQMVEVFREIKRVLRNDGTVWLNIGDSYASARDSKSTPDSLRKGDGTAVSVANNRNPIVLQKAGLKHKDLVGIPWRVAFALQADGWYLRQDIIWAKPNPMPESVTDRCTKSHEYLFLLTKSSKYFFDNQAIKEEGVIAAGTKGAKGSVERQNEKGVNARPPEYKIYDGKRNKRDVWTVNTKPFKGAHFAVMPEALVEPCILAGSKEGDTVLDPFTGSGTVAVVALRHRRNFVGIELNPNYVKIAEKRIIENNPLFNEVEIL